jgi:transcriptional regulator with XRE-family HTH domain
MRPEHGGTYGRALFKILRHVGISQEQVCQRLGVSKAMVSMWATGKRPIAHRNQHIGLLLRMEQEGLEQTYEQGMSPEAEAIFRAQHKALWDEWQLECQQDYLYTEFATRCRALARYGTMEPDKIAATFREAEGLDIERDAEELAQIVRCIRRVPLPPEIEALHKQLRTDDQA